MNGLLQAIMGALGGAPPSGGGGSWGDPRDAFQIAPPQPSLLHRPDWTPPWHASDDLSNAYQSEDIGQVRNVMYAEWLQKLLGALAYQNNTMGSV